MLLEGQACVCVCVVATVLESLVGSSVSVHCAKHGASIPLRSHFDSSRFASMPIHPTQLLSVSFCIRILHLLFSLFALLA